VNFFGKLKCLTYHISYIFLYYVILIQYFHVMFITAYSTVSGKSNKSMDFPAAMSLDPSKDITLKLNNLVKKYFLFLC